MQVHFYVSSMWLKWHKTPSREDFCYSKGEPGLNLLLGQKRPEAGGQGQISSQPGQMGSLWLQGPEHWYEWVRPALPTSQGKDLAVLKNWGDGEHPSHGLGQFQTNKAKLNWEKQQLHIKQWDSFESSVLGFGAQVLVKNKRWSLGGFIASTNT